MLTMDFHGVRRRPAGATWTWRIAPATILVSGPAEVLNGMDSIVLDEFDLASLGSTTNYSYAIPIPEGCENLSGVTRATLRDLLQRSCSARTRDGHQLHPRPTRRRAGTWTC